MAKWLCYAWLIMMVLCIIVAAFCECIAALFTVAAVMGEKVSVYTGANLHHK